MDGGKLFKPWLLLPRPEVVRMTTKATILKTIREHCLECMGGSWTEVEQCTAPKCKLFALRFGKDPKPSKSRSDQAKKTFGTVAA